MADSAVYLEPDFLLTGWRDREGQYNVAASSMLSLAELKVRTAPLRTWDFLAPGAIAGYDLRAAMENIAIARHPSSYRAALDLLLRQWDPDAGAHPLAALEPGTPALRRHETGAVLELDPQVHSSTCGEGPNHPGPCRP